MSKASEAQLGQRSDGSKSPFGEALFRAVLKRAPEDFVVHEHMEITPHGHGEHLWLHVEKRGLDTWAVRDALAAVFGCGERDIGHAGLKDRHALTRQWFSVRTPVGTEHESDVPEACLRALESQAEPGALRVVRAARHSRKLRIGAHSGNAFRIVLHDVQGPGELGDPVDAEGGPIDGAALQRRIEAVRTLGLPNRYGEQRFGRGAETVRAAREMLLGRRSRRVTRRRRGLLLSAARSHLFNRVLDARIERDDWHRLLPGEPAMLSGSRSLFVHEAGDATIAERLRTLDVSPTGPLPGRGASMATGECAALEAGWLRDESALVEALAAAGVDQARRALRVAVPDLQVTFEAHAARLTFVFSLPPGSYATSLLALFGVAMPARVAPTPAPEPVPAGADRGSRAVIGSESGGAA